MSGPLLNRPLPPLVLTVLVWSSSSAHPEKRRGTLDGKGDANDARFARYPAPVV